jgi:hypothetical protein
LQELLSKPKPQVPPRSSRRPQLHRTSDSVGSFCISGVGEVAPQVDASAGSFSSNNNSSSSEVGRSRDEGAAEHQSVPLTACRPRRRKSPADGPFSGLSVDVFLCGGACSVWELWRRHGETCLARCRAHCTSGSASSPDACPHKLLLTLTMELAEEELPREQTEEHAQDVSTTFFFSILSCPLIHLQRAATLVTVERRLDGWRGGEGWQRREGGRVASVFLCSACARCLFASLGGRAMA